MCAIFTDSQYWWRSTEHLSATRFRRMLENLKKIAIQWRASQSSDSTFDSGVCVHVLLTIELTHSTSCCGRSKIIVTFLSHSMYLWIFSVFFLKNPFITIFMDFHTQKFSCIEFRQPFDPVAYAPFEQKQQRSIITHISDISIECVFSSTFYFYPDTIGQSSSISWRPIFLSFSAIFTSSYVFFVCVSISHTLTSG